MEYWHQYYIYERFIVIQLSRHNNCICLRSSSCCVYMENYNDDIILGTVILCKSRFIDLYNCDVLHDIPYTVVICVIWISTNNNYVICRRNYSSTIPICLYRRLLIRNVPSSLNGFNWHHYNIRREERHSGHMRYFRVLRHVSIVWYYWYLLCVLFVGIPKWSEIVF